MKGLLIVMLGFSLFGLSMFMAKSTKKSSKKGKIIVPNFSTSHREESDWGSGIPGNKDLSSDDTDGKASMPLID